MGPQSLLWEREIAVKSGCGEYFVKCKDGYQNQETWIRDVTMIEWITSPPGTCMRQLCSTRKDACALPIRTTFWVEARLGFASGIWIHTRSMSRI